MNSLEVYKVVTKAINLLKNGNNTNQAIELLNEAVKLTNQLSFKNIVDEDLLKNSFDCEEIHIIVEGREATLRCKDVYIVIETDGQYEANVKAFFNSGIEIYNKTYKYDVSKIYNDIKKNILSKVDIFQKIYNKAPTIYNFTNYDIIAIKILDDSIVLTYGKKER